MAQKAPKPAKVDVPCKQFNHRKAWAGVGGATNVAEGEMAARLQAGGLVATKRTRRGRKGKAAAAAAGDGGGGGLSLVDDYSDDPD